MNAELPVVIRRVLDDGRRAPAALTVPLGDLFDFHMAPSYPPGGPPRLAAKIRRVVRDWTEASNDGYRPGPHRQYRDVRPEWMTADVEVVIIDHGQNSLVLLSALGHLVIGHACPDCAPPAPAQLKANG
jgi:hypothetical protein